MPINSTKKLGLSGQNQNGFSLLELLIAMTVVMIMLGFVAMLLAGVQKQFNRQRPRADAINNAQTAMDAMVRVIRMAGTKAANCPVTFQVTPLKPSLPAGNGIYSALQVQADWNSPDCNLNGVDENVTFLVANDVFYIDAALQKPLVDGIGDVRFKFYDANSVAIADPVANAGQISLVAIEIDTAETDGTLTTIRSSVQARLRS